MYLEHFGLARLPFESTSNGSLYVDLPGHLEACNVVLFGLRSGEGIIEVVGEVGTGKTALCGAVLERLGDGLVPASLSDPALPPQAFLAALAHELGIVIPPRTPIQLLKQRLHELLLDVDSQGRRVALFVDEAQTMPLATFEALRLLSNLESVRGKLLQIVLLGQPELDVRLASYALRPLAQRIAFRAKLSSLDRDDCRTYVQRRLRQSGAANPGLFGRAALAEIHRASGGIPRLINSLCHKSLMAAFSEDCLEIERRHALRAISESEGIDRWRIRPLARLRAALRTRPARGHPMPAETGA